MTSPLTAGRIECQLARELANRNAIINWISQYSGRSTGMMNCVTRAMRGLPYMELLRPNFALRFFDFCA